MHLLGNLLILPLKIIIFPIYIIFAFLALITGLVGMMGKIILGFFHLLVIAIAIIGFLSGTPIWIPMIILLLFLGISSILLGFFPFIFRNLFRGLGQFIHFWF